MDATKELDMITNTIILLLLLALAVMPVSLESSFTKDELVEMGIRLENSSAMEIQ
jgi:hypothetical protein